MGLVMSSIAILVVFVLCTRGTHSASMQGDAVAVSELDSYPSQCVATNVMQSALCAGQPSQPQCWGLDSLGCKWVSWSEEKCVATTPTGVSMCPANKRTNLPGAREYQ